MKTTFHHGALDLRDSAVRIIKTCFAGLRDVATALIDHLEAIPRSLAASTTLVLLAFSLGALLLFTVSCARTLEGLQREQAIYRGGTNVVGELTQVAPYLPPPVSSTMQIVLAVASSLLATWNLHQQGELRKLRTANGGSSTPALQPQPLANLVPPPTAPAPPPQ